MKKLSFNLILISLLTIASIQFAQAASFDCSKASTAVEGSICANQKLSKFDDDLAAEYKKALSSTQNQSELKASQLEWIKKRNNCGANVDCLESSYRLRILELIQISEKQVSKEIEKLRNEIDQLRNQTALLPSLKDLDGNWYSSQWKYGYSLQNGIGVATSTNSPNFKVGDNIIELKEVGDNKYTGRQVYKDGKFYKVTATLLPDGKLQFEGELNAKWTMERIGPPPVKTASTTIQNNQKTSQRQPSRSESILDQANKGDLSAINTMGNLYKHGNPSMGIEKNIAEAKRWFEIGASKGYPASIFNLGIFYETGVDGIPVDKQKAKEYYRQAANLGFAKAKERLEAMERDSETVTASANPSEVSNRPQQENSSSTQKVSNSSSQNLSLKVVESMGGIDGWSKCAAVQGFVTEMITSGLKLPSGYAEMNERFGGVIKITTQALLISGENSQALIQKIKDAAKGINPASIDNMYSDCLKKIEAAGKQAEKTTNSSTETKTSKSIQTIADELGPSNWARCMVATLPIIVADVRGQVSPATAKKSTDLQTQLGKVRQVFLARGIQQSSLDQLIKGWNISINNDIVEAIKIVDSCINSIN